jgi:peptidoglycan/xylan/chitin deacetylase (PgdA/CDA1 family)
MLLLVAAVGFGTLVLSHLAPFPFLLEAFRPDRSLWHMEANPSRPAVYLTFDDGPNTDATPMLLDVLQREGATATFFLIDAHITDETAPLVRRMFQEDHAVAIHSSARWLMLHTPDGLAGVLREAAARIEQFAGTRPCSLFRPHAGWRSSSMYAAIDALDYRLVGWSCGGCRTGTGGARTSPRRWRHASRAAPATSRLIPALRARGFTLGRLPCGP